MNDIDDGFQGTNVTQGEVFLTVFGINKSSIMLNVELKETALIRNGTVDGNLLKLLQIRKSIYAQI
jgi:hypothetical protein